MNEDAFLPLSDICKLACQDPDSAYLSHSKAGYISRMNLFKVWDIDHKEFYDRLPEDGRFIPLTAVTNEDVVNEVVDKIILLVLDNMILQDPRKTVYYLENAVNEVLCNIIQHSEASRAFVVSQVYPTWGTLEISICDNGMGFSGSFQCDSYMAIKKAIDVGVSSKAIDGNRGMGIPILIDIVSKNMGQLKIHSMDQVFDLYNILNVKENFDGVSIDIGINLKENFSYEIPAKKEIISYDQTRSHCYFDREGINEIYIERANLRSIAQRIHNRVKNLIKDGKKPVLDFSRLKTTINQSCLSELKEIYKNFPFEIRGSEFLSNMLENFN